MPWEWIKSFQLSIPWKHARRLWIYNNEWKKHSKVMFRLGETWLFCTVLLTALQGRMEPYADSPAPREQVQAGAWVGAAGAGGTAPCCTSVASFLILNCQEQSRRKADLGRIKTHLHSSSCHNFLLPHTPPTPRASPTHLLPSRLRLSTKPLPFYPHQSPFPFSPGPSPSSQSPGCESVSFKASQGTMNKGIPQNSILSLLLLFLFLSLRNPFCAHILSLHYTVMINSRDADARGSTPFQTRYLISLP